MDFDPVLIVVLSVTGAGMLLTTFMIVMLCTSCSKCCKCGHSNTRSHDNELESGNYRYGNLVNSGEVMTKGTNLKNHSRTHCEVDTRTLKDSVLYMEAPPAYHDLATEYPRVYGGQYYIGMGQTSDTELQPWRSWNVDHLEDEQPPDYNLVAPY